MGKGGAHWKREEVPDHKFDFIDVREYHSTGFLTRFRYLILYLLVIKSFIVYLADIYTAITLLVLGHFSGSTGSIYDRVNNPQDDGSGEGTSSFIVPIQYGKWIFFGCIIFSFLLLAYEVHKSRAIVRSRDISYAYTNVMANNWYSLRSYDHFCFFCQINNSKKKKDEFAFFIFFTFKGWKRLLVADGPRQVINAFTLYAFAKTVNFSTNFEDYYQGNYLTAIMLLAMSFTLIVFAISFVLLIVAALMYIPLIIYIKGNLKEYCCHKIDKRISELVQYKKQRRLAKQAAIARAEAKGDFSHLKNKRGEIVGQKIPQPTLPSVDIDLNSHQNKTAVSAGIAGSKAGSIRKRHSIVSYTSMEKLGYESPAFGPQRFQAPGMGTGGMNQLGRDSPSLYNAALDPDEYSSNAHLMMNMGPVGIGEVFNANGSNSNSNHNYNNNSNTNPSSSNHNYPPSHQQPHSHTLSLPTTTSNHTSPDSYPHHFRGLNSQLSNYGSRSVSPHDPASNGGVQMSSSTLLDSLGPIGTSPLIRPQVRGFQQQQEQYGDDYVGQSGAISTAYDLNGVNASPTLNGAMRMNSRSPSGVNAGAHQQLQQRQQYSIQQQTSHNQYDQYNHQYQQQQQHQSVNQPESHLNQQDYHNQMYDQIENQGFRNGYLNGDGRDPLNGSTAPTYQSQTQAQSQSHHLTPQLHPQPNSALTSRQNSARSMNQSDYAGDVIDEYYGESEGGYGSGYENGDRYGEGLGYANGGGDEQVHYGQQQQQQYHQPQHPQHPQQQNVYNNSHSVTPSPNPTPTPSGGEESEEYGYRWGERNGPVNYHLDGAGIGIAIPQDELYAGSGDGMHQPEAGKATIQTWDDAPLHNVALNGNSNVNGSGSGSTAEVNRTKGVELSDDTSAFGKKVAVRGARRR